MMIRRIRNQFFKELEQFGRDRLGVALAFILPVIALLIIGFAIRLEAKNIPLVVRDLDQSTLSRSYIEQLYATNLFVPAKWYGARFPDALDRGTAQVQVTIPVGFAADVDAGRTGEIQVVVDGSDVINARVTQLAIDGTTLSAVQNHLVDTLRHKWTEILGSTKPLNLESLRHLDQRWDSPQALTFRVPLGSCIAASSVEFETKLFQNSELSSSYESFTYC